MSVCVSRRTELHKMRFELTGSGAGRFPLPALRSALLRAGATRLRERYGYGWRNQPRTFSFAAPDQETADQIANTAMYEFTGGELSARLYAFLLSAKRS